VREMFELAKDDTFKLQTTVREDEGNNLDLQLPYMLWIGRANQKV
jgi:hypothetical protein